MKYKGTIVLTVLSALAGWSLGNESLALFGWGVIIFLPAIVYYVAKNEGLLFAILAGVSGSLITSFLAGIENGISIFEMVVPGLILFFAFQRKLKEEYIFLLTTFYFYVVSLIEDFYFGPPKDLTTELQSILQFRWGLYFLTSALFSLIVVSSVVLIGREKFNFKKVNFGALPIIIFILGGIFSLIKWIPILQMIGINAILTACGFFLIQGFGVTVAVVENKNPIFRFIAIFLAILFPLLAIVIITLLGLFDFWFDFRKLQGGRE